eukprot:5965705-Pyramimonas_sp.AAC.1
MEPITLDMLDAALATIPGASGRGADAVNPWLSKEASKEAKFAFIGLLGEVERHATLPLQQL